MQLPAVCQEDICSDRKKLPSIDHFLVMVERGGHACQGSAEACARMCMLKASGERMWLLCRQMSLSAPRTIHSSMCLSSDESDMPQGNHCKKSVALQTSLAWYVCKTTISVPPVQHVRLCLQYDHLSDP